MAQSYNEANCDVWAARNCENLGPKCTALKACCAGKTEPARSACDDAFITARYKSTEAERESTCTSSLTNHACQ